MEDGYQLVSCSGGWGGMRLRGAGWLLFRRRGREVADRFLEGALF